MKKFARAMMASSAALLLDAAVASADLTVGFTLDADTLDVEVDISH